MTYSIHHITNAFLQKDFANGQATITPLKMQKLVFFLNGWYLALVGEPVIENEFRAWKYGPVEEQLYHLLKEYKGNPITNYLPDEDGKYRTISENDSIFYQILNMICKKYGSFSATELSAMTHEKDTPWDKVYNYSVSPTISHQITKSYFEEKLEDAKQHRNNRTN